MSPQLPLVRPRAWRRIVLRIAGLALIAYVLVQVAWLGAKERYRAASDPTACQEPVTDLWVKAGAECLAAHTYRSATPGAHPDLVVVLHGDAPFVNPGYQYAAARGISQGADSVVSVALLRPGYTDSEGRRSSGRRGAALGENYTPSIVDALSSAIAALKQTYQPAHVIVVGHSGGSAITGDIIGRHPGLVDAAVLVSCPCDLGPWRRHMAALQQNPWWFIPAWSLSPQALADGVDPKTIVHVVVGTADDLAPPSLSRAYAARLRARGVAVHLVELPGAPHDILLDSRVIAEIVATVAEARAAALSAPG